MALSSEGRSHRVEICGGIASGKTSLAQALASTGLGFTACFEDFQHNPFYDVFYADPTGNAFETEITFLLQHFNQLKRDTQVIETRVFDFGLSLDLAYSRVTLPAGDQRVFDSVFYSVVEKVRTPSLIVRLQCSVLTELKRIRARGRAVEHGVKLGYLEALEAALDQALGAAPFASVPRVELNSEHINFINDPQGIKTAVELVIKAIANKVAAPNR